MKNTLIIASDHAGYELKQSLINLMGDNLFHDLGTNSDKSVDYPDLAHPVAEDVKNKRTNLGIVICGSGNGVAMTANKHKDIRAAICWTKEIARLAREHNNANIISIPARVITISEAREIVEVFINTEFEGGRHKRRTDKINLK